MEDENHSSSNFQQFYRCFPISISEKPHLENGNRIILPESSLERLSLMEIQYPMTFEIRNPKSSRVTHCGVSEFSADEGAALLPDWMMQHMKFEEMDLVEIKNVNLVAGKYIKLRPHSSEFLRIPNPKDVLERNLRGYSCLTAGDTIMIMHEGKEFYIDVLEAKPEAAISMVETDCEVDFAPPLDHNEQEKEIREQPKEADGHEEEKLRPFMGLARRLDGSSVSSSVSDGEELKQSFVGQKRKNVFGKPSEEQWKKMEKKGRITTEKKGDEGFQAFSGKSNRLSD